MLATTSVYTSLKRTEKTSIQDIHVVNPFLKSFLPICHIKLRLSLPLVQFTHVFTMNINESHMKYSTFAVVVFLLKQMSAVKKRKQKMRKY